MFPHLYIVYSVWQSDGNSFKINTFRVPITSELMISSNSEDSYSSIFVSSKFFFQIFFKTCGS